MDSIFSSLIMVFTLEFRFINEIAFLEVAYLIQLFLFYHTPPDGNAITQVAVELSIIQ